MSLLKVSTSITQRVLEKKAKVLPDPVPRRLVSKPLLMSQLVSGLNKLECALSVPRASSIRESDNDSAEESARRYSQS
jgi:hypothetical protein